MRCSIALFLGAFWGHVGGFAAGVLAALIFRNIVPVDGEGTPIERGVMSGADIRRLDLH